MGSKYPVLPSKDIVRVLSKLGFQKVSQKGSHSKYKLPGNPARVVIVPMHNEIAKGTLKSILEQADVALEEFLRLLSRDKS